MSRSFVLLALVFSILAAHATAAAGIEFVRVWPGWRSADSFDRIAEYFTGRENNGREIVVRTHPDTRVGFYYLVRAANSTDAIVDAKFVLQVIAPDSPNPKTYTFRAALPHGQNVFDLGLTGPEWRDRRFHPVAWKLELRGADDRILASAKSFLWEKPAK